MSELRVRDLTAKDLRIVLPVLARCRADVETFWQMLASGRVEAGGVVALLSLIERVPELWGWFADLAGMTPEELDAQPPEVLLDIIDQLRRQPGAASFFGRLSRMLNISVVVTR